MRLFDSEGILMSGNAWSRLDGRGRLMNNKGFRAMRFYNWIEQQCVRNALSLNKDMMSDPDEYELMVGERWDDSENS